MTGTREEIPETEIRVTRWSGLKRSVVSQPIHVCAQSDTGGGYQYEMLSSIL